MSRNTDYQFVDMDAAALEAYLIQAYERIVGVSMTPASPERLFVGWVTSIILQERGLTNWAGNQNIPSRAEGENLDALAELMFGAQRPAAQPATCTVRFSISAAQTSAVLVPMGTRVTDASSTLYWETTEDAYISIGSTYVDVPVKCQTDGEIGNGYVAGQLDTVVDLYPFCAGCANTTTSANGADEATDDEFYTLLQQSMDQMSTAGAAGSYIYHAKKVSTNIADVVVNRPDDGEVAIYVLMDDGTAAGAATKAAVLAACNADEVRPLTDSVSVEDPDTVSYDITFTYYIPSHSDLPATEIQTAVNSAVAEYTAWQAGKLGRDINPSYLIGLLMQTGIKRVALTAPTFSELNDGSDNNAPELAALGTATITNGGYEDE